MPNEHTPEPSKTAGETFDLHKALVDALPDYQIGVQGWFAEEKKPRWSVTVGGECGQRTLVRVGVGFNATPLYSRGEALRAALAALGDASLTRAEHQAIDRVAAMTSYHDFRVRPVPYPGDGPGATLGSRLYPLVAQPAPAPASSIIRGLYMLAVKCPDGTVERQIFRLSAGETYTIGSKLSGRLDLFSIQAVSEDFPSRAPQVLFSHEDASFEKRTGADAALGWLDARMNPKVAPAPEAAPIAVGSPLVPTFWPVPVPEAPTPEAPAPKLHKLEVTEEELQLLFAGLEEIHAAGQEVKAAMLTHKLISQSGQIRTNLADAEPMDGQNG